MTHQFSDPEFTPLSPPAGYDRPALVDRVVFEIDDNGCYVFQGPLDKGGYGRRDLYGRTYSAHRALWLDTVGQIPAGYHVDHLCRNRACVNVDHLEPVTNVENVMRGESPAARNARATHCGQGHEYTDETTRFHRKGFRICGICTPAFVSMSERPHGTRSRYRAGCRCDICRTEYAKFQKAQKLQRAARMTGEVA